MKRQSNIVRITSKCYHGKDDQIEEDNFNNIRQIIDKKRTSIKRS